MRTPFWFVTLALALAAGGLLLATGDRHPAPAAARAARSQAADSGVRALLYARPFALTETAAHTWRAETPKPTYRAGWLLVLEVERALVRPQDRPEPVLYVGRETAERFNHGWESGRVVAIVPSAADAQGWPALELSTAAIWFGAPELPEQIDAAAIERAAALAPAAQPFGAAEIAEARARAGEPILLATRTDLDELAAQLVLEHAPEERDLAEGVLVPR